MNNNTKSLILCICFLVGILFVGSQLYKTISYDSDTLEIVSNLENIKNKDNLNNQLDYKADMVKDIKVVSITKDLSNSNATSYIVSLSVTFNDLSKENFIITQYQ